MSLQLLSRPFSMILGSFILLSSGNGLYCKDLDYGTLELLLVQVDKKNLIEFPFNCYTLLIHILY